MEEGLRVYHTLSMLEVKKNLYHEPLDMDYFSCIRFNTLFPYSHMGESTQVENPQVCLIL